MTAGLQSIIEQAWEGRERLGSTGNDFVNTAVEAAIRLLDRGEARVAEKGPHGWTVN
jgi:2,3,4,5-tetrahydropyridine-2-carboxylate N-succinyltransferase